MPFPVPLSPRSFEYLANGRHRRTICPILTPAHLHQFPHGIGKTEGSSSQRAFRPFPSAEKEVNVVITVILEKWRLACKNLADGQR